MNKRTLCFLALLLLGQTRAANGQTYIQSQTTATSAAGNNTAIFSAQPAAGDTVVAGVVCYGPAGCPISSITDNLGNSYSQIGPTTSYGGPTTNITNVALYCASGILSGSNFTVTATLGNTGGGDSNLYIAEYSGLTCNVDQSASGSLTGGTATTLLQTSSSPATTNAHDLLVAVGGATTGGVATAGSGYHLRQNGNSGTAENGGFEDQTVTATGSYSGSMTLASSTTYWAMVMVALKGSAAGTPPTITGFNSTTGPVGTSVTITGTNFTGATVVKFNGTAAASFTVNSATQIAATVPTGATTGHISVTTPSGTATSSGNFTVTAGGGITYIQSQSTAVGTSGNATATFSTSPTSGDTVVVGVDCYGPTDCPISSITDNFSNSYSQIGPTATYGGSTTNVTRVALYCASGISSGSNFTVTAILGNSAGGDSNLYIAEYSGLTCNVDQSARGSLTGGTATTLLQTSSVTTTNGADLLVTVGSATTGNAATSGTGYTLRQNGNNGTAEYGGFEDETVSTTGSYSGSMSLATGTTYWATVMVALKGSAGGPLPTVTSFTPTSGSSGTSVTITGTNFTGATSVRFNGTAATSFTVNSATQIAATVPSGATTGPISVTTPSGTGTSSTSFTVTTSGGAITYIQSQKNATPSSATSLAATFSTTPTAGDTIVVGVDCYGSTNCTTSSITDSAGNSYAQIGPTAGHGGAQNITNVWLYCASGIATGSNFTVTAHLTDTGSGGDSDIYIAEYSGVTCGVDQSATGSLTSGTATTLLQTSSVTTTNANDLLVAIGSASTGNAATAGSGYTLRQNDNGGTAENGGFEDQIVSATGSYSGSMTLAVTTTDWAMVMVALKGSSTGGGGNPPTITSFSPTSGPANTSVTITGTNLTGATSVKFNGTPATTFNVNSSTQIAATISPTATSGPISVTTPAGTATSTGSFTITVPAPTITSCAPTSGSVGTSVTITGTTLTGATTVQFNGIAAASFSVSSSTQIVATVPSTATSGPISITTPAGTGSSTSFTVVPTITGLLPTSGPSGTPVTITGTGFGGTQGSSTVTFNGTAATSFPTWNATTISTTVPSGASTGPVVVTIGGVPSNAVNFSVQGTNRFSFTGSLNTARYVHTATLLNNGTVLVVGGHSASATLASAELYDPATGTFTATGSLNTARAVHTATLLNTGMVLIVGGNTNGTNSGTNLASAELYNPSTGTFTAIGSLNTARAYHTATLLNTGMVLISGGVTNGASNQDVDVTNAELYNPVTGTFTATGNLNTARVYHTATLLNNGTVLIAGGCNGSGGCLSDLGSAELYNPATGSFTVTGSLNTPRQPSAATMLNNGLVLVAGGYGSMSPPILASAELYNPTTQTFTVTGSLSTARDVYTATLLNNGMVLVAGGYGNGNSPFLGSAELYDPTTGLFTATGSLNTARAWYTSTLLNNGTVLMVGGFGTSIFASAELYQPSTLTPTGLVSIAVSPVNPTVAVGMAQQFGATGTFTGNTTQTLASAMWRSSSPIASITNDAGNHGEAAALGLGSATISACAGSVCGSTTMTNVTNPLAPTIASLSPNYGVAGTVVTITGTNFGTTQGTSTVTFGSKIATPSGSSSTCPTSWSDTCIVVPVPSGVSAGSLNVAVTVSNAQSNAVTFTDTITQDFLISATPASQSASSGTNAVYTVNISPLNGFTGTVSLSVSGLPSGATPVFSPTTISNGSGTSTLTVSVLSSTPTGNSALTITGTSGGLSRVALVTLLANRPAITSLSLPQGPPQMGFVITGTNFGATQGTVTFSSATLARTPLTVISWSPTIIKVQIPVTMQIPTSGSISGNVVVTVNNTDSIGAQFTVTGPFGCSTN